MALTSLNEPRAAIAPGWHAFDFTVTMTPHGGVAKWLCSGLQSRLRRFDPDPRLHIPINEIDEYEFHYRK